MRGNIKVLSAFITPVMVVLKHGIKTLYTCTRWCLYNYCINLQVFNGHLEEGVTLKDVKALFDHRVLEYFGLTSIVLSTAIGESM